MALEGSCAQRGRVAVYQLVGGITLLLLLEFEDGLEAEVAEGSPDISEFDDPSAEIIGFRTAR